jgi:hypothetical protein
MRKVKLLIAAALLATTMVAPAAADAPIGTANEIIANAYDFPSGATGTLEIKGCKACATLRFQITAATEFFIGNERVSLAQLRAAFAADPHALTLLKLAEDRRDVTLIFISASSATAGR